VQIMYLVVFTRWFLKDRGLWRFNYQLSCRGFSEGTFLTRKVDVWIWHVSADYLGPNGRSCLMGPDTEYGGRCRWGQIWGIWGTLIVYVMGCCLNN